MLVRIRVFARYDTNFKTSLLLRPRHRVGARAAPIGYFTGAPCNGRDTAQRRQRDWGWIRQLPLGR
ncbi:MAG: hypothetical protein JWO42_2941 [Chloroflexi bacterium]|nr:hypothetical protein [Chloroflexota bacterium]